MTDVDISNIHKSVVIWEDRVISKEGLVYAEPQFEELIRQVLTKKIEADTTTQFEKLVAEAFGSFSDGLQQLHLLSFDIGNIDIKTDYDIGNNVYTFIAERFLVLRSKTTEELMKSISVYK